MIKVMFVCYGNICRSPMAEFLFKDMVKKEGMEDKFLIKSSATSYEEFGNPVHRGTREKLGSVGISTVGKVAEVLLKDDYEKYDFFLGMEKSNLNGMQRIFGGDPKDKAYRLLDFSDNPRDILDPWYTGNFDVTYNDIYEGLKGFLAYLKENKYI